MVNKYIFREYDIRGKVVDDFPSETVVKLGGGFGTFVKRNGFHEIALSGDIRLTTPELMHQFKKGVLSTGVDVINLGILPTPANYYSMFKLEVGGAVQITGSHNPPEFNGFKMSLDRKSVYGKNIQVLREYIDNNDFDIGEGNEIKYDIKSDYKSMIIEKINIDVDTDLRTKIKVNVGFPTKSYRDWPIEYFSELCTKMINKNPNVHFLIYGGCDKNEKKKISWLFDSLMGHATSLIGMTLRETAAVMSKTHLYIGVNTGPTHIMSTFDIPMIVLNHCLLKNTVYGALGHPHYFSIDHPNDKKCSEDSAMSDIPVKTVLEAADSVLKSL